MRGPVRARAGRTAPGEGPRRLHRSASPSPRRAARPRADRIARRRDRARTAHRARPPRRRPRAAARDRMRRCRATGSDRSRQQRHPHRTPVAAARRWFRRGPNASALPPACPRRTSRRSKWRVRCGSCAWTCGVSFPPRKPFPARDGWQSREDRARIRLARIGAQPYTNGRPAASHDAVRRARGTADGDRHPARGGVGGRSVATRRWRELRTASRACGCEAVTAGSMRRNTKKAASRRPFRARHAAPISRARGMLRAAAPQARRSDFRRADCCLRHHRRACAHPASPWADQVRGRP